MSKLSDLKLEPLSRALAERLVQDFPSWKQYLGRATEMEGGLELNLLHASIPSQNPNVPGPLQIRVELDRMVHALWLPGSWHYGFAAYRSPAHTNVPRPWKTDTADLDKIVEWLHRFTNEEIAAYQNKGSGGIVETTQQGLINLPPGTIVRSWHGTHDRASDQVTDEQLEKEE